VIIDFHQHLGPRNIFPRAAGELVRSFPDNGYDDVTADDDGFDIDAYHRLLDKAGIDAAVSIPSPNTDRAALDIGLELASRSERIRPFVTVDPRSEYRPTERFRRLLADGAAGLKIHPVQNLPE
jgi:predicted TIM-barrel fold metal-dependent hydrolase